MLDWQVETEQWDVTRYVQFATRKVTSAPVQFGRQVTAAREAAGLTQDQLASRTNIAPVVLAEIESGRLRAPSKLRRELVRELCDHFEPAAAEDDSFFFPTEVWERLESPDCDQRLALLVSSHLQCRADAVRDRATIVDARARSRRAMRAANQSFSFRGSGRVIRSHTEE